MRDLIARALVWVLQTLLPARGRHTVTPEPAPDPRPLTVICRPRHPIPAHVLSRTIRYRGEEIQLVRPYIVAWEQEQQRQHERRRAAAMAAVGKDYPYTYPGAPFPVVAVAASA